MTGEFVRIIELNIKPAYLKKHNVATRKTSINLKVTLLWRSSPVRIAPLKYIKVMSAIKKIVQKRQYSNTKIMLHAKRKIFLNR